MKTIGAIIILAIVLTISGCTTKKKISTTVITSDSTNTRKDSVYIEYRDSISIDTHFIPADQAYIEALFECDSLGVVRMREITRLESGRRATASISFREGVLSVECRCDSMEIYSIYRERYKKEYVSSEDITVVEDTTTVKEKVVKTRLPWWMYVGGSLIFIIIIILGAYKLYKKFM